MEIYNTLTKKKEFLEPREDKKINMFVCGPTVYDHIHIGNARTFVFFDVVAKYLKYKYGDKNVMYIQNITDIDNKIIERAEKEGIDSLKYAQRYSEIFKQDMQALGVTSPEYKNATDHIPEVIKQVQTLLDKGNAYVIAGDGIYFDLSTFPDYGKLSGRTALMANDAVSRIDDSDKKINKGDFAIWKFKQPNNRPAQAGDPSTEFIDRLKHGQDTTPSWPAPFGEGRPGWHIEDTAITEKYFGPQYDIHGGGQDLIFPHHEAEIAQQESASGLKPFVKYWMHVGFLVNKEAKMSKSAGNFETSQEVLKKYSKEVLRFYLLSNHYRSPLDFSDQILKQSEAGVNRIYEFMRKLELAPGKGGDKSFEEYANKTKDKFLEALDNDFNVPEAFAVLFELIRKSNTFVINDFLDEEGINSVKSFLKEINEILGIVPSEQKQIPAEIKELIEKRDKLRENNLYNDADKIRAQIEEMGYKIDDTIYGPLVTKK